MADVDPKLQSNRVKDLGGTVRPSPQDRTGDHRRGVPDPHDVRPRVLPCGASLPDLRAHVPGLRPMVADRRPVGAGRGRARRTGRGVRRGRVADRQQGRAVGNRRQGTHPRGRVRACHGPWRGRGEGDAPARRGHGVKAHRSGPLAKGHVAGISAGAQHRGQHVDVHQLGGHGYRSGGPAFRQIPVLRDPGRALGTGPVPGDLEQGRHPRRDRPDPQARPSERRNMDVRPRTHRGPEPEERAVGVGPDRLGAVHRRRETHRRLLALRLGPAADRRRRLLPRHRRPAARRLPVRRASGRPFRVRRVQVVLQRARHVAGRHPERIPALRGHRLARVQRDRADAGNPKRRVRQPSDHGRVPRGPRDHRLDRPAPGYEWEHRRAARPVRPLRVRHERGHPVPAFRPGPSLHRR